MQGGSVERALGFIDTAAHCHSAPISAVHSAASATMLQYAGGRVIMKAALCDGKRGDNPLSYTKDGMAAGPGQYGLWTI